MKNLFLCLSLGIGMALAAHGCADGVEQPASTADASMAKGQSAVVDAESAPNILAIAIGSKDHSTLVAAVQAAALEDVLTNAGPLTVFAPNNAAFEKLPAGTLENLLKPENKATLARIIKYHATPGTFTSDNLRDGQQLYMATGHYIPVKVESDQLSLQGARVLGTVKASNGIVHVIDAVLLPPEE